MSRRGESTSSLHHTLFWRRMQNCTSPPSLSLGHRCPRGGACVWCSAHWGREGGVKMDRVRGGGEREMRVQGFPPHTHTHTRPHPHLAAGRLPSSPLCWNGCLRIKKQGGWTTGPQDWDWDWRARAGLDYYSAVAGTRLFSTGICDSLRRGLWSWSYKK